MQNCDPTVEVAPSYAGGVSEEFVPGQDEKLTDYSDDGVDLTLIRWMLSLTPEERLRFLNKRINEIETIRDLNGI